MDFVYNKERMEKIPLGGSLMDQGMGGFYHVQQNSIKMTEIIEIVNGHFKIS